MKKLFLILLLIGCSISANAQISAKYQGEVDFGYSIGVGTFSTNRVNVHTIQGAKISDYFSAGLGVGLDYYHEGDGDLIVPIFLNMKGYLPVTPKLSPFISLDLGYGIGATENLSGLGGFLFSPSLGVKYSLFKFQIAYTSQRLSEYGIGFNMDAIRLSRKSVGKCIKIGDTE